MSESKGKKDASKDKKNELNIKKTTEVSIHQNTQN